MSIKLELNKQLLQLEMSKVNYTLDSIVTNKGKVETDNPIPYEDELTEVWDTSFNSEFSKQLDYLNETSILTIAFALGYDALTKIDTKSLTPIELTSIIEASMSNTVALLDEPFNIQWALTNSEDVSRIVESMYSKSVIASQAMVGLTNPANFSFNLVDEQAIQQLSNIGVVWSSTSSSKEIITPIATRLARQALSQGLGVKDAGRLFKEGLANVIPLRSNIYYQNLASVVINRARNFSRILTLQRLGVTYVQIVAIGDDRTCGRCLLLDGSVFRVTDLSAVVNRVISASTPEDVIEANPFINGIDLETNEFMLSNQTRISTSASSEELAGKGVMPPFHPGCRCLTIMWTA